MNFRIYIRKLIPKNDGTNGTAFTREFCIHDGFSGMKEHTLIDPKLKMIQSSAGSFECTFHKDSVVYKSKADDGKPWVEKGKTRIFICWYKDAFSNGNIIWEGRVLTIDSDFYGQEHIYAEGALSYFNDSIQPVQTYKLTVPLENESNPTSYGILKRILQYHNSSCPDKIIELRAYSTMGMDNSFPTNPLDGSKELSFGNETTMSAVSKLISVYGGKMRLTYTGNTAYLEWYVTGEPASYEVYGRPIAEITFTKNMMDYEQKNDLTSIATYAYPRGYKAYGAGDFAVGDDLMDPNSKYYKDQGISFEDDVSPITWNMGAYIWLPQDARGAAYEWVYDGETYNDTMATGFSLSALAEVVDKNNPFPGTGALEVHPGEVYYITLVESDSRACYVVTAGHMGRNGSVVVGSQKASNVEYPVSTTETPSHGIDQTTVQYPTTWRYQKIQIPTDTDMPDALKKKNGDGSIKTDSDGKVEYTSKFYLNISARGTFNDATRDGTFRYLTDDAGNRKVGIWKGRPIPVDEHITLKGLGDGSYDVFFATVNNVTVPLKCKKQENKDRQIFYPEATKVVREYETQADFDNERDSLIGVVKKNEQVKVKNPITYWLLNENLVWEECVVATADELGAKGLYSGNIFLVTEDQSSWVCMNPKANNTDPKSVSTWVRQKEFHRDGYYIYMDSLVKQYGRIEKFLDYSNVIDPDELETNALAYLYSSEFESFSMSIKAADLAIIAPNSDDSKNPIFFNILGRVKVTSTYHGVLDYFYIQEVEYDFNDLGNTQIEIGYSKVNRITETTKDLVKVW